MKTEKKALPKNKENNNKPVQEALPSSRQKPMGDEDDLEKKEDYETAKDDGNDTNSVGIKKNDKSSPIK